MGYLCPVCEEPFGDDTQCANHLAVTAILHGEAHEQWLAEAVDAPDWESVPRTDLAEIVAEHAEETSDHDHPGDHTHPVGNAGDKHQQAGQPAITDPAEALDADGRSILNEARELTRRMQQRGPDAEDEAESKES